MSTDSNAGKPSGQPEGKMKLTLRVDPEPLKKFKHHALESHNGRQSDLFTDMVNHYCKRFVISDHKAKDELGKPPKAGDE